MQTSGLSIDALGLESRIEMVEDQAEQTALRNTGENTGVLHSQLAFIFCFRVFKDLHH